MLSFPPHSPNLDFRRHCSGLTVSHARKLHQGHPRYWVLETAIKTTNRPVGSPKAMLRLRRDPGTFHSAWLVVESLCPLRIQRWLNRAEIPPVDEPARGLNPPLTVCRLPATLMQPAPGSKRITGGLYDDESQFSSLVAQQHALTGLPALNRRICRIGVDSICYQV